MQITISTLIGWQPKPLTTIADDLAETRKALLGLQDEIDDSVPPDLWQGDAASAARTRHTALRNRLNDLAPRTTRSRPPR